MAKVTNERERAGIMSISPPETVLSWFFLREISCFHPKPPQRITAGDHRQFSIINQNI